MLTTFHFPRIATNFPSTFSQILQELHHFFQQFSMNSTSFCFILRGSMLYNHHWGTVCWIQGQNHQESRLLEVSSTMANWWILQLEHPRAKLVSPFTFLIVVLLLFWWITRGNVKIHHCFIIRWLFRIPLLCESWYAFCRPCNVDLHDAYSFWFD